MKLIKIKIEPIILLLDIILDLEINGIYYSHETRIIEKIDPEVPHYNFNLNAISNSGNIVPFNLIAHRKNKFYDLSIENCNYKGVITVVSNNKTILKYLHLLDENPFLSIEFTPKYYIVRYKEFRLVGFPKKYPITINLDEIAEASDEENIILEELTITSNNLTPINYEII